MLGRKHEAGDERMYAVIDGTPFLTLLDMSLAPEFTRRLRVGPYASVSKLKGMRKR